jgi:tetratricopeptide (TPR) repeat protein
VVSDYSNEYFFQNKGPYPWESAVYEDGYAYAEASTAPLLYRKMFCWGTGRGGWRWQDFLSLPGEQYLEVQAGLAPTQLHTADIDAGAVVDWVQAFTALRVEPEKAHGGDYRAAAGYVEDTLERAIPPASLEQALEAGRRRAGADAEILALGSGWGTLERQRAAAGLSPPGEIFPEGVPPGLSFPDESIGDDERPWACLIRNGRLPPRPSEAGPGSFAVDAAWESLLLRGREDSGPEDARRHDWLTPYHLGVIVFERGETEKAEAYWRESAAAGENAWAYRNLAIAALRRAAPGNGKADEALAWYKKAFDRKEGRLDPSFAEEYIPLLIEQGRVEEAAADLAAYTARSEHTTLRGPLLDAAARIAFAHNDDAALDGIFSLEPAHIREGNTTLVDLWTAREIRRLVSAGMDKDAAETRIRKALASGELEPPWEIDFRMYTGS